MPQNYVLLDRIELNNTTTSVTFDNIPQTGYTDLKIVFSVRSTDDYLNVSFNGLTTNLSSKTLGANSGGPFSISASNGLVYGLSESNSWTANTFNNAEMYIPNYTSSNAKSWSVDAVTENNGTAITLTLAAGLWNSTAAITSVSFNQGAANLLAGSTFSLYGIANASTTPAVAPKASGGNVIATDGTYWYHAFLSNGTFTPQVGLTADVLVVAGGGGGGDPRGGGGGAGGLLAFTSQSLLNATNYTCTVGAGGTAAQGQRAGSGTNSTFGALTAAVGGGGGGGDSTNAGLTGGSGGGGCATAAGGSATSGQGNAGGTSLSLTGGGGGGAGAVGANASSGVAGNGGAGVNTYSSWATATNTGVSGFYAGGGGGGQNSTGTAGTGGSGGGGNGQVGNGTVATAGAVNTGSGGGAGGGVSGSTYGTPAAGGSGIIIIRYAA